MFELLDFLFWNGRTKSWDVPYPLQEGAEEGYIVQFEDYVFLTPEGYANIYSFYMRTE